MTGTLVVSVEQAVAAPFCTARLADAGARVLKIERPEGDFARQYDQVVHGESAYFVWLNRGKESVCIDLTDEHQRNLLRAMIRGADVFIQNLGPGVAERHGIGSAQLREQHERLITVDISGYGDTGDYADMRAYDLLVQAESALASITGSPAEPGRVGVSICDIACGMYAHAAVLEALIEREQTSRGQAIKVSLFDAIADWMTVPLLHQEYAGSGPARVGLHHPTIAPYGMYAAQSGEPVLIAVQNEREWRRFCSGVLDDEAIANRLDFSSNSRRVAHRAALDDLICQRFSAMPRPAIVERLKAERIAFGSLNTLAGLSRHPQLRRARTPTPSGEVNLVAPPAIHTDRRVELGRVPALGEHTGSVFEEFAGSSFVPAAPGHG